MEFLILLVLVYVLYIFIVKGGEIIANRLNMEDSMFKPYLVATLFAFFMPLISIAVLIIGKQNKVVSDKQSNHNNCNCDCNKGNDFDG